MKLADVETYEDLEQFLREFTNVGGDPAPYDFVGAIGLFDAILTSLCGNSLETDIEDLREDGFVLTDAQRDFLQKIMQLD